MKQLALLALSDRDVDLLRRVRHHPGLALQAIYHPDPAALVIRLADMASLPVYTDLDPLIDLSLDVCVGDDKALELMEGLSARVGAAGRPSPLFVPLADVDRFLCDPDHWKPEETLRREALPATPPEAPRPAPPLEPAPPESRMPAPSAAPTTPAPTIEIISGPPRPAPAAAEVAPAPAAPAPPPVESAPATLGVPTIDLFYEPARLAAWLAEAAARLTQAGAAVIWRRENDGRRFPLMSFAPGPEALPSIRFDSDRLEALTQAGHWQSQEVTDDAAAGRHLGLFVPLPGEAGPFGLLALFRPVEAGEWPRAAREELTQRVPEIGRALARCVHLSQVGRELKDLQFKERVRDLLLDGAEPAGRRWERLLRYLVGEIGADVVCWFEASADREVLRLAASAASEGALSGDVTVPAGVGRIGRAFRSRRVAIWFPEEPGVGGEEATLPVLAGFGPEERSVGVLLFEGLRAAGGEEGAARVRLERLQEILRPLAGGVTANG